MDGRREGGNLESSKERENGEASTFLRKEIERKRKREAKGKRRIHKVSRIKEGRHKRRWKNLWTGKRK